MHLFFDLCDDSFEGNLMRKLIAVLALLLAPCAYAQTGAVRCGKLLDVRAGKLLSDQVVVFDKG